MQQINNQPIESRDKTQDGAVLDVVHIFPTIQGEGPFVGRPSVFIRLAGCNLQCPLCDTDYTSNRHLMSVQGIIDTVFHQIKQMATQENFIVTLPLIVITGGEPFRQNISSLVNNLIASNFIVQVETNGAYGPPEGVVPRPIQFEMVAGDVEITEDELRKEVEKYRSALLRSYRTWYAPINKSLSFHIVCSPKTSLINNVIMKHAMALKYVVEAGNVDPKDGLPTTVLGKPCRPARPTKEFSGRIYISPADCKDETKNQANIKQAVDVCMKYGYTLSLQTHKLLGVE